MSSSPRRLLALYVGTLIGSASLIAALCLIVNLTVDPLWYWRGNVVTGVNFAFDERLEKTNRLLSHMEDYDCVVMGSSRATLLPERMIQGHRCFNLAFSDGRINEFLLYAKYLRARGFAPSLLIVGVDQEDFIGPMRAPDVPDFIRKGSDPPSMLQSYLSLDALGFSIRTLEGNSPHHRYYDADFNCRLLPRTHLYEPARLVADPSGAVAVHPERAALYTELRRAFPEARAIGYVPPVSAWMVAQLSLGGGLDAYLSAIGQVALSYDEFIDFAVPSEVTEETSNTYDGSHYAESINARIAVVLSSNRPDFGIDWRSGGTAAAATLYRRELDRFILRTSQ